MLPHVTCHSTKFKYTEIFIFSALLYLLLIDKSYVFQVALYKVILKSVKHFKNSQQIDYAMDRGNSYADRERNFPSFFKESPHT
jgi:hypothetical protein